MDASCVTGLRRAQIDLTKGVLSIPDTKNGKPHSLPITPLMREILERRCKGLKDEDELFAGVSAEHLSNMAMRAGSPRFMLHDLRKLVATVGEKLGLSSAVLRRILNHTAPKTDVLHRHYVGLLLSQVLGQVCHHCRHEGTALGPCVMFELVVAQSRLLVARLQVKRAHLGIDTGRHALAGLAQRLPVCPLVAATIPRRPCLFVSPCGWHI